MQYIRWFSSLSNDDVAIVGGKNASLGEMLRALKERGIRVPDGFATTADAYQTFLRKNDLEGTIRTRLQELEDESVSLEEAGAAIRTLFYEGEMPREIADEIREAYRELGRRYDDENVDVAARSSATAEDLPEASFAGQQETFLNVSGEDNVVDACKQCFASLFTDRAITYREQREFEHMKVALSVGVQKMVRSDKASAGVLFTIDTETGFPDVALINGAWGLGENVVKGTINPDQYTVYTPFLSDEGKRPLIGRTLGSKERKMIYGKNGMRTVNEETSPEERSRFVLSDDEILQLARWGVVIENHYERPMDIEWAKDGDSGELFIVQARPETVQARAKVGILKSYELKESGDPIVTGLSIGQAIATGEVRIIKNLHEANRFDEGCVLVTDMTDPDWGPLMRKASGIVTDHGGRTSHAAIVSRELGLPAVIGTGNATEILEDGQVVTLSCAEGDQGVVYDGALEYEEHEISLHDIPEPSTRIMMNVASPAAAMRWWQLPARGVGLARMEYIINNVIKAHPMALVRFDEIDDDEVRVQLEAITKGYDDKPSFFVDVLACGIGTIAASQYPDPVILRLSDFKTNEYAGLIGGERFEPQEENPMLGWRGASRYYSDEYKEGFELECRAIRRVRGEMGFDNVIVMVPFCRTPEEADRVLATMAEFGLKRGGDGLQVYVMAEIPSNILQAEDFAARFDGFSIGSNDLTQLVLGVDRDAENLSYLFDERNASVKWMITELIERAHASGRTVGICGQAPSDYPEFAEFLVGAGIDSISLNPDSVLNVLRRVAEMETTAAS